MASTNGSGSKRTRSSAFSPTPTYLTGRPTCLRMATTTPPLAVPSSLASTRPVQRTAFGEVPGLADAVLAGGGVEDQQDFVRGLRDLFAQHAMDLGQLLHQVLLGLQPAGRVDDANVGTRFDGPGDRAMGHCGRVAAAAARVTISTPSRLAQMVNCSTAAARKVSA